MSKVQPKSIQVFPRDVEQDEKIDQLAERLRTSRAGFAAIAIEFAVDALEDGRARVINGHIVVEKSKAA